MQQRFISMSWSNKGYTSYKTEHNCISPMSLSWSFGPSNKKHFPKNPAQQPRIHDKIVTQRVVPSLSFSLGEVTTLKYITPFYLTYLSRWQLCQRLENTDEEMCVFQPYHWWEIELISMYNMYYDRLMDGSILYWESVLGVLLVGKYSNLLSKNNLVSLT